MCRVFSVRGTERVKRSHIVSVYQLELWAAVEVLFSCSGGQKILTWQRLQTLSSPAALKTLRTSSTGTTLIFLIYIPAWVRDVLLQYSVILTAKISGKYDFSLRILLLHLAILTLFLRILSLHFFLFFWLYIPVLNSEFTSCNIHTFSPQNYFNCKQIV